MKSSLKKNIPRLNLTLNTFKSLQIPKMQQKFIFRCIKTILPNSPFLKSAQRSWTTGIYCLYLNSKPVPNVRTALLDSTLNQSLEQITLSLNPTWETKCIRWPASSRPSPVPLFSEYRTRAVCCASAECVVLQIFLKEESNANSETECTKV